MTTCEWTAILDSFEARIHAQREALAMGPAALEAWLPPAPTTPLPRDLLERATALVWQCRELEDAIEQSLSTTLASLDRLLDAPPANGDAAEPVYFDSRV